jgi:hypothetical protein
MKDYKKLAETIYKRKSVRIFSNIPVEILENDADLIKIFELQPLLDNIKIKIKVLRKSEIKNDRSDYCIAFYSEEKPYYFENIGFIGQQLDLELQSRGLGTCWCGMKKPYRKFIKLDGLASVITMTVGHPKNTEPRTYPDDFNRKDVKDIIVSGTAVDQFIEAVRIAPSAVNLQPWLIEKEDNKYNFFIRKPKNIMEKIIGKIRHIDIGIAMAHLFVKAKADGLEVSTVFNEKEIKQGNYIASIVIK